MYLPKQFNGIVLHKDGDFLSTLERAETLDFESLMDLVVQVADGKTVTMPFDQPELVCSAVKVGTKFACFNLTIADSEERFASVAVSRVAFAAAAAWPELTDDLPLPLKWVQQPSWREWYALRVEKAALAYPGVVDKLEALAERLTWAWIHVVVARKLPQQFSIQPSEVPYPKSLRVQGTMSDRNLVLMVRMLKRLSPKHFQQLVGHEEDVAYMPDAVNELLGVLEPSVPTDFKIL